MTVTERKLIRNIQDSILGELSYQMPLNDLYQMGFPPVPLGQFPPCGHNPACNRQQLYEGLGRLPPSFAPSSTPTYSDLGFTLLAHIAERLTGRDFKDLMQEKVLGPLGLKNTFATTPSDSLGVIPGNRNTTTWAGDLGEEWPYVIVHFQLPKRKMGSLTHVAAPETCTRRRATWRTSGERSCDPPSSNRP